MPKWCEGEAVQVDLTLSYLKDETAEIIAFTEKIKRLNTAFDPDIMEIYARAGAHARSVHDWAANLSPSGSLAEILSDSLAKKEHDWIQSAENRVLSVETQVRGVASALIILQSKVVDKSTHETGREILQSSKEDSDASVGLYLRLLLDRNASGISKLDPINELSALTHISISFISGNEAFNAFIDQEIAAKHFGNAALALSLWRAGLASVEKLPTSKRSRELRSSIRIARELITEQEAKLKRSETATKVLQNFVSLFGVDQHGQFRK